MGPRIFEKWRAAPPTFTVSAVVMGHADGGTVDPTRTFKDLGLTSQGAVDLRNRAGQRWITPGSRPGTGC